MPDLAPTQSGRIPFCQGNKKESKNAPQMMAPECLHFILFFSYMDEGGLYRESGRCDIPEPAPFVEIRQHTKKVYLIIIIKCQSILY